MEKESGLMSEFEKWWQAEQIAEIYRTDINKFIAKMAWNAAMRLTGKNCMLLKEF